MKYTHWTICSGVKGHFFWNRPRLNYGIMNSGYTILWKSQEGIIIWRSSTWLVRNRMYMMLRCICIGFLKSSRLFTVFPVQDSRKRRKYSFIWDSVRSENHQKSSTLILLFYLLSNSRCKISLVKTGLALPRVLFIT